MPLNNYFTNQHIFERQRHGFDPKFLTTKRAAEQYEAASVAMGPARRWAVDDIKQYLCMSKRACSRARV